MTEQEARSRMISELQIQVKNEILQLGKPVFVVSDIDDTLANAYHFDSLLQVHIPHITDSILRGAQNLPFPLLLATGRPAHDSVVSSVWRLLSKPTMPIIVENGGAIFHPETQTLKILATRQQIESLEQVTHMLSPLQLLPQNGLEENELLIDMTRKTSIEIRIQNKITKIGNPDMHSEAASILQSIVSSLHLEAVSSGSSVSIHAPEITKGAAVLLFLSQAGIRRDAVTLLSMGDNLNDLSLFSIADISVGVGEKTRGHAQFVCPLGELASTGVLSTIGSIL